MELTIEFYFEYLDTKETKLEQVKTIDESIDSLRAPKCFQSLLLLANWNIGLLG